MPRGLPWAWSVASIASTAIAASALVGCASSSSRVACAPGAEVACACATGGASVQRCGLDGVYAACACPDGGPSALDAPCVEGETARCDCPSIEGGLRTCHAGAWGACTCTGAGGVCVPLDEAPIGVAEREVTGEDFRFDASLDPVREVIPTADAYLVVREHGIQRVDRQTHVVSARIDGLESRGAALRGTTLYVASADALATYDTELRLQTRVETSEAPSDCVLLVCGLWDCTAGDTSDRVVLDAVTGAVRSRALMRYAGPVVFLDEAAGMLGGTYVEYDSRGVLTRPFARGLPGEPIAAVGRSPHRTFLTPLAGYDAEGCIAGDEASCFAPRFSNGGRLSMVGASPTVAVGLTDETLFAVDLATGTVSELPLADAVGHLEWGGTVHAVTHDPWTGQAVVAVDRCPSCDARLRFVDLAIGGEP